MTIRSRVLSAVLAASMIASACQGAATAIDSSEPGSAPATAVATPTLEAIPTVEPQPQAAGERGETNQTEAQDTASESAPEPEPEVLIESRSDFSPELVRFLDNLTEGYRTAAKAWAGFSPDDHPVVLAMKNGNGQLTGALAINHPTPELFDAATQLEVTGTPLRSLYVVTSLNADDTATLQALTTFDFNAQVGGSDVFLMVAGGPNAFFEPTTKRYVSTLLHEMFHRYQGQAFEGEFVAQDIDGYDYSPENLELIALEDRALGAAIEADTDEAKRLAVRHVVAIRQVRLAADSRVSLDGLQEVREGTARFLEHRLAGTDETYDYNVSNFGRALIDDISPVDVKTNLAFGRWYASGAAALRLLQQLDAENIEARVEQGAAPIDILAQIVNADDNDAERLVAEARTIYDPTNELAGQAARAAEAVTLEPPHWSGNSLFGQVEPPAEE